VGGATSTIDLDSDGYFDLCKKNQNHCNQNVFWSPNMAKMLWRAPLREPAALPQTPSRILGRKDGEKEGKKCQKAGRGEEGQKGGGK